MKLIASAIIQNSLGQIFLQKRAADRPLYPGCWDLVGGHVDPGETLESCLEREIYEETGWQLKKIRRVIHIESWQDHHDSDPHRMEYVFEVEVDGGLERPKIEEDKTSDFIWADQNNINLVKENRKDGDQFTLEVVKRALEQNEFPSVAGLVVAGEKQGRTIGFPTANLDAEVNPKYFKTGVYGGRVLLGDEEHLGLGYFGPRHVFDEEKNNFEVYVVDLDRDLYDQRLTFVPTSYFRPPQKVSGLEELKTLLSQDLSRVKVLK